MNRNRHITLRVTQEEYNLIKTHCGRNMSEYIVSRLFRGIAEMDFKNPLITYQDDEAMKRMWRGDKWTPEEIARFGDAPPLVTITAKVKAYAEYEYNSQDTAEDSVLEEMYRDADRVNLDIMAHEFSKNLIINYYPEERRYEITYKDKT